MMKYIIAVIFSSFLVSNIYILHMNKKASVKRQAFRWWMAIFGVFLLMFAALMIEDLVLMVFVIPVIAWVVFISLRFTKFCDWCGRMIKTNLPLPIRNIVHGVGRVFPSNLTMAGRFYVYRQRAEQALAADSPESGLYR